MSKLVLLSKLLTVYPAVCGLIAADRLALSSGLTNYLCAVPRSIDEITRFAKSIFDKIVASGNSGIPAGAVFVSVASSAGTETEPDKNATVLKAVFSYREAGAGSHSAVKTKAVFIKLPTGRMVAIWI
jgi:hypothetical protein